jgi:hypothetical protein
LEIWTREDFCSQPTSVADRAKRCRVIPNRSDNASPARTEGTSKADGIFSSNERSFAVCAAQDDNARMT